MLTSILILSLVFIIAYYIFKRREFASSLPPGPSSWPIVGNLLQLDKNDLRKTFTEWHKKYGPIHTVWLGTEPNIFITGYDLMQELFIKRGDEFTDRPYAFLMEHFTNGRFGIVVANGEQWKDQRRFSLQTLRNFGFGKKVMEEKIESEISKLLNMVDEQLGAADQKTVNFKPLLDCCVSNIISSVAFGRTYLPTDPTFIRLKRGMEEFLAEFSATSAMVLNSFPWLRFLPINGHFGYDRMRKAADQFIANLSEEVKKHKQDMTDNCEPTDFASAYLQEMKKRQIAGENLAYFSDYQLVCILGDIWSAGMETTVTTLAWGILLMMHNPEVQEKVHNEIMIVTGSERSPSMNDRTQLPYTTAVIQEIQRYANILPINLARTVNKDTDILGYNIPKGMTIIPQISVLHLDETIYKNPKSFMPERFMEADGKTLKKCEHLLPFSLGKRQCLGESLARMELFLIFTSLLQRFSFACDENQPIPTLQPNIGFTASSRPYNVSISRRQV